MHTTGKRTQIVLWRELEQRIINRVQPRCFERNDVQSLDLHLSSCALGRSLPIALAEDVVFWDCVQRDVQDAVHGQPH